MKKSTKIALWVTGGVVVVVAAALVVGPYVYAGYVQSNEAAPPTLSATSGTSSVDVDDLSGAWAIGSGSFAGYRVDEVLYDQHVTVTGRTDQVTGDLTVDGLTLTAATITVDVASISTPEPARDAYFRDSALEVSRFPTATFTLTAPVTAERPAPGEPQSFTAEGDLTMHGVTQHVSVDLQAALTADGGQVTGSIPVTFDDYGVQAPSLGFVTVENSGSVEFLLNLTQQ
ncbi:YceI family protein [Compostimonas suwonensis]|nr:YceI family protein [Compostimonas suwonensis]